MAAGSLAEKHSCSSDAAPRKVHTTLRNPGGNFWNDAKQNQSAVWWHTNTHPSGVAVVILDVKVLAVVSNHRHSTANPVRFSFLARKIGL
jgi:hypothetical protein